MAILRRKLLMFSMFCHLLQTFAKTGSYLDKSFLKDFFTFQRQNIINHKLFGDVLLSFASFATCFAGAKNSLTFAAIL